MSLEPCSQINVNRHAKGDADAHKGQQHMYDVGTMRVGSLG